MKARKYFLPAVAAISLVMPTTSQAAAPPAVTHWDGGPTPGGVVYSATFGNDKFVAATSAGLLTSTNGLNWTLTPTTGVPRGVTFANGTFVAVGYKSFRSSLIMTSTNGTDWQEIIGPTNIALYSVSYGAGNYVASGVVSNAYPGATVVSSNATDWVAYTNNQPFLSEIAYGEGTFLGIMGPGGEGLVYDIYSSTNGFTWTKRNASPTSFRSVTFGNHAFVAAGAGAITRSTNGVDFQNMFIGPYGISKITFGNGTFFTANEEGTMAISTNGLNWQVYAVGAWFEAPGMIAYGNSRLVVSEYWLIYRSGDFGIAKLSLWRSPPGTALSLEGLIDRPYQIQISDNLQNWSDLMIVTNPLPTTEYFDPTPIQSTNRLYRAYLKTGGQ